MKGDYIHTKNKISTKALVLGLIVGLVIGGVTGFFVKPKEIERVTETVLGPTLTETLTERVEETVTETVSGPTVTVTKTVMPTPTPGVLNPVLFVHGWTGDKIRWDWMIDKFVSDGWPREILYAFTFSNPASSTVNVRNAEEIAAWVDQILAETGAEKVDLVSHSMGGLSTRYYVKFLGGIDKVDDYVCLASPQHGSTWTLASGDWVPDSDFLEKLNDGDETAGGVLPDTEGWRDDPAGEGGYNGAHVPGEITWTTIRSFRDTIIQPPETAMLDGAVNLECEVPSHALYAYEQVYEWVKAAIE